MILGSESGSARRGVGNPLLMESDLNGQVLWMSSRARAALGEEAGGLLRVAEPLRPALFPLAERGTQPFQPGAGQPERAPGASAVRQIELERERLGRDLHTGVGQLLVAIRLQLEVIATQLPDPPAAVQNALERIATLASDAGEQVRALSRRLHPPEWQRLTPGGRGQATVGEQRRSRRGLRRFLRIEPLPREPEQEI